MSKKNHKKSSAAQKTEPASEPKVFGFEEMLSELEAIVAEAESRQAEDLAA